MSSNGFRPPAVPRAAEAGFTIWLTGLVGAGKSTIARGLEAALLERGQRVEVLDGKQARLELSRGLGYSKPDRDVNVSRLAFVAHLLARNGVVAIVAAVSPYREARAEARRRLGRFVEVHVRCPADELARRDATGLYARALKGDLPAFTGVSDPYEEPLEPEVVVDTDRQSAAESVAHVLDRLAALGYLVARPARAEDGIQQRLEALGWIEPSAATAGPASPPARGAEAAGLNQPGRPVPAGAIHRLLRRLPARLTPAARASVGPADERSTVLVGRVAEAIYRRTVRDGGWTLEIGGLGPNAFAPEARAAVAAIALGSAEEGPPLP